MYSIQIKLRKRFIDLHWHLKKRKNCRIYMRTAKKHSLYNFLTVPQALRCRTYCIVIINNSLQKIYLPQGDLRSRLQSWCPIWSSRNPPGYLTLWISWKLPQTAMRNPNLLTHFVWNKHPFCIKACSWDGLLRSLTCRCYQYIVLQSLNESGEDGVIEPSRGRTCRHPSQTVTRQSRVRTQRCMQNWILRHCSARDWDGKDYLRIIPRVVW